MAAKDLKPGEHVRKADGTSGTVESLSFEKSARQMYNLTVGTAHTYFVGDGQWLVHNMCPGTLDGKIHPTTKLERGVTALGNSTDTQWVADNLPEVNTLVGVPDWGFRGNIKWLDAAMRRGDDIWLVTDPDAWRLLHPNSVYFDELKYVIDHGYPNVFEMWRK